MTALLLAAVACAVAWSPSSARAGENARADDPFELDLEYSGLGNVRLGSKFRISGADSFDVGLFSQIPDGVPDDVIFNLSTRFAPPPPPPCLAASETTVRCPLKDLRGVFVDLGTGDDDVRSDVGGFIDPLGRPTKWVFEFGYGDDRFTGGGEDDITMAGPGNDILRTRGGRDRLLGGRGNDRLFGGPEIDFFLGGPGDDFARGGGGNDKGSGGPGDDNFRD